MISIKKKKERKFKIKTILPPKHVLTSKIERKANTEVTSRNLVIIVQKTASSSLDKDPLSQQISK